MDVSYSVWRDTAADKQEVSGESFSFLFDRRYSNRLNRMSRVFFEAYAKATSEVSAEEDRFPSLSEIESRMESGAIYAYKDRLMRSTEFFEEVKISGISYLIPKARRFADVTGTYTDLILDLEKGEVVLPKREKASAIPRSEEAEPEEGTPELASIEEEQEDEVEDSEPPSEEAAAAVIPTEAELEEESSGTAIDAMAETPLTAETESEERPPDEYPAEIDPLESDREAEAPKAIEPMETSPLKAEAEVEGPKEETEAPKKEAPIETKEPVSEMEKRGGEAKAAETERPSPSAERVRAEASASKSKPHRPEKKPEKGVGGWGRDRKGPILALAGLALITVLVGFYIWSPSTQDEPATPTEPSDYVSYSAYLTNASENTYLNLEVTNPKGLESKVELVLPPDVDKSISATGGIVTISYTNNTVIQLTSSNNASVSVALTDEYVLVPVTFNLAIPQGYESSVLVYDKDYQVSRTNSTISLWCNCTEDHLDFDQIYNAKKVSGGPGPQEGSPANDTANMSAGSSGPEPKDDL